MHLRITENLLLTTITLALLTHTTQQQLGVGRTHAGVGEQTHLHKHHPTHPLGVQPFQETSSVPFEKTSEASFESNRSHDGQPAPAAAAAPHEYRAEESCVQPPPPPPIAIEPGSRSKPGKVPVLASAQTLARRLAVLLTARNPLWTLSFRLLRALFAALFRFLYAAVAAQFRVLTLVMLWFWDEILFPMTFPIRLVIWATVILPISLTTAMLKKLKPVILFALSAVTMGVLIGSLASSIHHAIGDWLFPLHHHHHHHHHHRPASKKKPSEKKRNLSLPEPAPPPKDKSRHKKRALRAPTEDDCQALELPGFNKTQSSHEDLAQIHGTFEKEAHAGSSCEDDDDDDHDVGEGEEDEFKWDGCTRETAIAAGLGPAQTRYTSAIEPSHARARHRHHHRPNASSAQHIRHDPIPPSPDAPSILKLPRLTPPSASSPSSSRSPPASSSSDALRAPRKKKVTFKTD